MVVGDPDSVGERDAQSHNEPLRDGQSYGQSYRKRDRIRDAQPIRNHEPNREPNQEPNGNFDNHKPGPRGSNDQHGDVAQQSQVR